MFLNDLYTSCTDICQGADDASKLANVNNDPRRGTTTLVSCHNAPIAINTYSMSGYVFCIYTCSSYIISLSDSLVAIHAILAIFHQYSTILSTVDCKSSNDGISAKSWKDITRCASIRLSHSTWCWDNSDNSISTYWAPAKEAAWARANDCSIVPTNYHHSKLFLLVTIHCLGHVSIAS